MKVSPLTIQIMIGYYAYGHPPEVVSPEIWRSRVAEEIRDTLWSNGLITGTSDDDRTTEKGRAWIGFILATPFPEAVWTLPPRKQEPTP